MSEIQLKQSNLREQCTFLNGDNSGTKRANLNLFGYSKSSKIILLDQPVSDFCYLDSFTPKIQAKVRVRNGTENTLCNFSSICLVGFFLLSVYHQKVISGTFCCKPHVEMICRSRYIGEKGPKSGSELGPKICCAVFFNLPRWIFLTFSNPLEPNTGYIYAESAFLTDFRFLTFWSKRAKN